MGDPNPPWRQASVDASAIARRHGIGSAANPIVNTAMLGAAVQLTRVVRFESLLQAIQTKAPGDVNANVAAATDGAKEVASG